MQLGEGTRRFGETKDETGEGKKKLEKGTKVETGKGDNQTVRTELEDRV